MNNHIDTSELKQIIMQILALTPQGKVTTNGQVARFCGYPSYSRYIGSVFKKLPHNTRLSSHRVIGAKGEVSFPICSEAYHRQLSPLSKEGVKSKRWQNIYAYLWLVSLN